MFNVTGQKWTSSQTLDQRANLTPDLTKITFTSSFEERSLSKLYPKFISKRHHKLTKLNKLEYGPKKPIEFLIANESEPHLFDSLESLAMKHQQLNQYQQSTSMEPVIQPFREIVPDFNEITMSVARPKKGLTIDLTSKIASKFMDDNRTELSEDSDRTLTPTQNLTNPTNNNYAETEQTLKESANKISIRLHHFKFDLPQSFCNTATNPNLTKPANTNYYNNFSAGKTMTHNSTNKSRSASQQREKQTGSPNTTTTTTTANASNCNFILKSLYNLDHLALLNSTIHGITGANELTSNPGVNRPNSSQMELPTEKKPSVKSHTNSIVRASRNLPVKKVSLVKAIEPTRLLSNTVELSGLVDTISNESSTAFDPHKLSHKSFESSFTQPRYISNASKISTYSGVYYPDGNWNRIPGSKLKTTTIKPQNLPNGPANNSFVLKYKQQKLGSQQNSNANFRSTTIYNRGLNGHQSAFNISRELSIIDLALPVKDNSSGKRRNNVTFNLGDGAEANNDLSSMAARIITSGGLARSHVFPSPIASDAKAPEAADGQVTDSYKPDTTTGDEPIITVDTTEAALISRNKTYTQYISQQQKKRQMVANSNKRTIKLYSQDISIGEGLNSMPNSLLIRRLKF